MKRFHNDKKRKWKVLNGLVGNFAEIRKYLCNYIIDIPRNIFESIFISNSHHLSRINFNDRSMFFRHVTNKKL